MKRFDESEKLELEGYLWRLGIDTNKAFRCLNPKHEDRHPSMRYDAKRHKVHCFSCGADYDIYDVREIVEGKAIKSIPLLTISFTEL